jgi:hypothetical protein
MRQQCRQHARLVRRAEAELALVQKADGVGGGGEFLAQVGACLVVVDGGAHHRLQHGFAERLGDVVIGAGVDAVGDVAFTGEAGEQHHRDIARGAVALHAVEDGQAVEIGQAAIEHHRLVATGLGGDALEAVAARASSVRP